MTEDYLDISRSVLISSPAGSGKTEKLSRRYIAHLKNGSDVERILAITFTEKAAAEMKERILSILRKEDPGLFDRVRDKMPRMRISTIHAFCLKLLKRFCLDLGLDPSLEVMDGFNADILWSESIYESLLEDDKSGGKLFYRVMRDSGVKGWNRLYNILNELHGKRPDMEFGLEERRVGPEDGRFADIMSIYSKCLAVYRRKKKERHCLDYSDLELLAYAAISMNLEWQNILLAFDEHTDHILVDEFQDTSSLQWRIIDKLTEEWRAGMGAKREAGLSPTIFLVGDDKQSIYSFRGANVSIFRNARQRLREWLGDEYHYVEVKENYRSLPAIIDFVNALFGRLMPPGLFESWKVEYSDFKSTRSGEGSVSLLLCEGIGNTKENRRAEATVIAGRIKGLEGKYIVGSDGGTEKCGYGDMAILLRNRTHLSVFEDALSREGIPFVVVKGIGFYNTPEIGILKSLLFFLIDSTDNYSLFNVLRSPLFSLDYEVLSGTINDYVTDGLPFGDMFVLLSARSMGDSTASLFPPEDPGDDKLCGAVNSIRGWLEKVNTVPYAVLMEDILSETGAWRYFRERQRYVNVKKFIKLIEEFEAKGLAGLEIREKLIKAALKSDEPKANVNTEGMDAVRIMTVHASKGLQFPMVFLPCLDEGGKARTGGIVMDEDEKGLSVGYEEDPDLRKVMPIFQRHKEKMEEEEKRLFYVAATRAMDHLCLSGVIGRKPTGKLSYLMDAFNLNMESRPPEGLPFSVEQLRSDKLSELLQQSCPPESVGDRSAGPHIPDARGFADEVVFPGPLDKDYRPAALWLDVTEEIDNVRKKHGDDWIILGRAFHRVFEGMSNGHITLDSLPEMARRVLRNEAAPDKKTQVMQDIILESMEGLDRAGYLKEIFLPQDNSYTELPFVLDMGGRVYRGRIDRVIVKDDTAFVYDYKTYPVTDDEVSELRDRYSFQMKVYREAVGKLFSKRVECYLFFTKVPRLLQMA